MTNKHYGSTFPILTLYDMVKAQFLLLDYLGINKVDHLINLAFDYSSYFIIIFFCFDILLS